MKKLIRRLSASSQYLLLRSDGGEVSGSKSRRSKVRSSDIVPVGHIPLYVGDEMERFVVSADLLNHPIFVMLLNKSAQEYGYEQIGVLRIPCHVLVFERILEALRIGDESPVVQELLNSLSNEFLECRVC
ncbi:auxin-responsive protein SAUR71-like [Impatiens glandulifera]|uniref:auxin-responsive protein SAUR71-like n=1 Tax=Impatiens glandulifera TaxID=253017 RepID=UPI001FB188B1|nr:auxin-responsive protein SAUR71-like [Impatiens glandulifera]